MLAEKIVKLDYTILAEDYKSHSQVAKQLGIDQTAYARLRRTNRMCNSTYQLLKKLINKSRRRRNMQPIK